MSEDEVEARENKLIQEEHEAEEELVAEREKAEACGEEGLVGGKRKRGAMNSPRSPSQCNRRIAVAVDLSDESAYALKWAVKNYLRPNDFVILLHVRPTSVLYGADWGASDAAVVAASDKEARTKMEDDFDALTLSKTQELAKPLEEVGIQFKTHIVKDHDMKERICLEVERLGVSACIMGSRGFGAAKRSRKARLGSVSDYCVHHCDCPVVVVRIPEEKERQLEEQKEAEAKAQPSGDDAPLG